MTIRRPIRLMDKTHSDVVESGERTPEQSVEVARRVCIYSERAGRILCDVATGKVPPRSSLSIFGELPANPEKPPGTCAFWTCRQPAAEGIVCGAHRSQATRRVGLSSLTPTHYRIPCPMCGKPFPPTHALACPKCVNPGGTTCVAPDCVLRAREGSNLCQHHASQRRRGLRLTPRVKVPGEIGRPSLGLKHPGCGGDIRIIGNYTLASGRVRHGVCCGCLHRVSIRHDGTVSVGSALVPGSILYNRYAGRSKEPVSNTG